MCNHAFIELTRSCVSRAVVLTKGVQVASRRVDRSVDHIPGNWRHGRSFGGSTAARNTEPQSCSIEDWSSVFSTWTTHDKFSRDINPFVVVKAVSDCQGPHGMTLEAVLSAKGTVQFRVHHIVHLMSVVIRSFFSQKLSSVFLHTHDEDGGHSRMKVTNM